MARPAEDSAGRRQVPIWAPIYPILDEQLAERAQPGKDGLVFVNTRGNTPHLSSFTSQTWKKARAAIGRPDLRWHDLRHTYVAVRIAAGPRTRRRCRRKCRHSSYRDDDRTCTDTYFDPAVVVLQHLEGLGAAASVGPVPGV